VKAQEGSDYSMLAELDSHYVILSKAIVDGRAIPFLGAGVNLCGRPAEAAWQRGQYLPSGGELAAHLARLYGYPPTDSLDLVRVCQYISIVSGPGSLYEELRRLFDSDYPLTPLHDFLAWLPALLRGKECGPRSLNQLVVTTNYDDMLERAYLAAGEPFDLVTYIAEGDDRGKFLHRPCDRDPCVIERPNEYRDLSFGARPVILKIHGAVDRIDQERDSYVITEDHYIDYLTRTDIACLLPVQLAAHLRKSHFLFLGYSLADWNLRVILHRIWGQQKLSWKSWAIQLGAKQIDRESWNRRGVEILNVDLQEYVRGLRERLEGLPLQTPAEGKTA